MYKVSPFQFGNIVSGDYFYNREDELVRIKQTLAGGNNSHSMHQDVMENLL